jgi:hypothetical protein
MWKRLSDFLYKITNGWVAFLAFVVFLLFAGLVLPGQAVSAETYSGNAGSPDLSFYYSAKDLYHMAEVYGEQGRGAYVRARFTFDLIWPLVYTFFLCTAITIHISGNAALPASNARGRLTGASIYHAEVGLGDWQCCAAVHRSSDRCLVTGQEEVQVELITSSGTYVIDPVSYRMQLVCCPFFPDSEFSDAGDRKAQPFLR